MAVFKLTWKWLYSGAGKGVGSWSENFYMNGSQADANTAINRYSNFRAQLASRAVSLISATSVDLAFPGISELVNTYAVPINPIPFQPAPNADVPQMALAFKCRAANGSKRTIIIKGIPDDVVKIGRYSPIVGYNANVQRFMEVVTNNNLALRTVDKSQTPLDVVSISSTGLLVMANDTTWAVGQKVQLYRCTDSNKQGVTGTYPITGRTDAKTFQLGQWGSNNAVVRGKARQLLFAYPAIVVIGRPSVTVGKVGSPHGPYVGRRKKGR